MVTLHPRPCPPRIKRTNNETIWLQQRLMAKPFDVDMRTINERLGNVRHSGSWGVRQLPGNSG